MSAALRFADFGRKSGYSAKLCTGPGHESPENQDKLAEVHFSLGNFGVRVFSVHLIRFPIGCGYFGLVQETDKDFLETGDADSNRRSPFLTTRS